MDGILKQEMDNLKREVGEKVDELSEKVVGMTDTVNEISFALMGNKFTKNGGIINEMIQLKADNAALEKRVEILEKEKENREGKDKILWTIVGAVGLAVLYVIKDFIVKIVSK